MLHKLTRECCDYKTLNIFTTKEFFSVPSFWGGLTDGGEKMLPYNGGRGIPSYCAANLLLVVGEGGKNTVVKVYGTAEVQLLG